MKTLRWILCVITVLSTIIMLFILPDTVPLHYDISGAADRWGSKIELLLMPAVLIACAFSVDPFTKMYQKKAEEANDEKQKAEHLSNVKVFRVTSVFIMFLFFFMNSITLYTTYTYVNPGSALPEIDMIRAVGFFMGIMIALLGNYMPKTRNNRNIGFRLPWTMYNDVTWKKSNRFSGYVFMVAGTISALCALLVKGELSSILTVGVILVALVVIMVFAYIVYRDEKRKDSEGNN